MFSKSSSSKVVSRLQCHASCFLESQRKEHYRVEHEHGSREYLDFASTRLALGPKNTSATISELGESAIPERLHHRAKQTTETAI